MTTPGDPNSPSPRDENRPEDRPGGDAESRPDAGGSGDEPAEPPVEPRPAESAHPDLPTAPETRPPAGGDEEATQVFQVPGGTPPYPGWENHPPQDEGPVRQGPSRFEEPEAAAHDTPGQGEGGGGVPPYGSAPRDEGPAVPGTTPSSPYGGAPGYPPPPPPGSPYGGPGGGYGPPRQGSGLATASLVLGVASPFLVFVCFTGVITAILSIIFGCVALAKRVGRGRAIAGIVISALSLVLFAIVAIWFWNVVEACAHLPTPEADRCVQERLPWTESR
ncbi:DUF4190 domain-containing protein [Nonomuraea maritima]|uniref:DUF4190 domain-containing protein n=1 Tax=Nonomuraea maritima TaxID=683260 RepID=UPI000B86A0B8|nr:DUF4190 domain-containing protein [Nonomuraea maritima]